MSTPKLLRVGFAGLTSGMPTRYANAFKENHTEQLTLSAVWDADIGLSEQFSDKFHIPNICQKLEDFYSQIDAAFLDPRNCDNEPIAIELLSRKIPVYISKPLAHNLKSAENILKTANQHKTAVMTASQFRFHPEMVKLAEKVKSGKLTAITTLSIIAAHEVKNYLGDITGRGDQLWRFDREIGGTPLFDLGIHATDMLISIAGTTAKRVFAKSARRVYTDKDFNDTFTLLIEHEDGLISTTSMDFAHSGYKFGAEIITKDEKITIDCLDGVNTYEETAKSIVKCWQENALTIPIEQMHQTMAILQAAKESAETDRWAEIKSSL